MKLKKGLKAVEMAEATIAPILKATAPPPTTPPTTQTAQPIQRVVSSGKDKFEITLDPPESPPVIRGPFNRIKIEPKSKNTPNSTQSTPPTNIQNASKILAYVKNNIDVLSVEDIELLTWRATWLAQARPNQLPPEGEWDIWMALAGRGWGKEARLSTPVPTPSGWTTMGAIKDGDIILDEQGKPTKVLKAHDVETPERAYKMVFDDGTEIVAGGEHQWVTWTHRDRKQYQRYLANTQKLEFPDDWAAFKAPIRNAHGQAVGEFGPRVRTTDEVYATQRYNTRQDTNHCIPAIRGLQLPDADLPIPPYVLGYWIANGAIQDGSLTTGSYKGDFDHEHVRAQCLKAGYTVQRDRLYPDKGHGALVLYGLRQQLKDIGLLENKGKTIPPAYLRASQKQRWELLRGLCDGDGYAGGRAIEYCSVRKQLAYDVLELVRSLGEIPTLRVGRATLNGKDCGEKYRVCWRPTQGNPFSLKRKMDGVSSRGAQGLRTRHRMLVRVEPVPPEPMRCLTVDSPNSLYLISEAFIATHNTRVGVQWLTWQCLKTPDIRGAVISPTSSDVRDTAFEGESGIISSVPESLVATYNRSLNEVVFKNGSRIKGYSAQEADRLRGPQHHHALLDELAAFGSDLKDPADASKKARDVMDMLRFGLRLGKHPQIVITTTPKPVPHVRDLVRQADKAPSKVIIVRGNTYENKANLAPSFFGQIAQYEGTQLGRQEIHAEMLDPEESGVIKRSWFQLWKNRDPLPKIEYVIQSYDTAYTDKTQNDPTACTTWGIFEHKGEKAVMLLDCWTDHLKFDDLVAKMRESYNALYGDPGRKPDVLLIEDKGSGISVQQTLQRLGLPVHTYNPGRADKLQRLHSVSHYFANGKVVLPESMLRSGQPRDWCEELVGQLCAFPLVDHDDLVDSTTSALALIRDQEWLMIDKYRDEAEVVDFDYYKRRKTGTNPYAV